MKRKKLFPIILIITISLFTACGEANFGVNYEDYYGEYIQNNFTNVEELKKIILDENLIPEKALIKFTEFFDGEITDKGVIVSGHESTRWRDGRMSMVFGAGIEKIKTESAEYEVGFCAVARKDIAPEEVGICFLSVTNINSNESLEFGDVNDEKYL
ncbi:MAG: DUF5104 domain-containing protein [Oscillospiraceae bacterium]|jgi:hypothetical protein|nr:DUF5104 domain-containing protein [Oscillospiraceae bacterium]